MDEFFVVEPGSVWACSEGKQFLVLGLANEHNDMPVMVIYQEKKKPGLCCSPFDDWIHAMAKVED